MTRHTSIGAAAVMVALVGVILPGWRLAVAAPIKTGDKIVVLENTHVQAGEEKLAAVAAGTELVAGEIQGDWVAVNVDRDGKKISGWLDREKLISAPQSQFAELFTPYTSKGRWDAIRVDARSHVTLAELRRFKYEPGLERNTEAILQLMDRDNDHKVDFKEFEGQPGQAIFLRLDTNGDGHLSPEELLAAVKKPTLGDLNERIRLYVNDPTRKDAVELLKNYLQGKTTGTLVIVPIDLPEMCVSFEGWGSQAKVTEKQSYQLMADYFQTGDMRRSLLARTLVGNESAMGRAQHAAALFKWADKNRDERLTPEEFKQALLQGNENEGEREKGD